MIGGVTRGMLPHLSKWSNLLSLFLLLLLLLFLIMSCEITIGN